MMGKRAVRAWGGGSRCAPHDTADATAERKRARACTDARLESEIQNTTASHSAVQRYESYMNRGEQPERIEQKISRGLADVFASITEEALPEVPPPLWRDELAERPLATDSVLSGMDRYPDIDSPYSDRPNAGAADTWPSRTRQDLAAPSPPLPAAVFDRDDAASAETLRNSEDDNWYYLDRIAGYLDQHQKPPMDSHTGFNAVLGREATRALGLPGLDDEQMIILMRAGLIVHHYASSGSPWRDALGAVEYEMQLQARREHEQRQFVKKRLLNQLAQAVQFCNVAAASTSLLIWRERLGVVRRTKYKLQLFDEQTLLPPYFSAWDTCAMSARDQYQLSITLGQHRAARVFLKTSRNEITRLRRADTQAIEHARNYAVQKYWSQWVNAARIVPIRDRSAVEECAYRLSREWFIHWRCELLKFRAAQYRNRKLAATMLNKWKSSLYSARRLEDQAESSYKQMEVKLWSHRFRQNRAVEEEVSALKMTFGQRRAWNVLHERWLDHKTCLATATCQAACNKVFIRRWRAETRLVCYMHLHCQDILYRYKHHWTLALNGVHLICEKSKQISVAENDERRHVLMTFLRANLKADRAKFEAKTEQASKLVASRTVLRRLRCNIKKHEGLAEASKLCLLRRTFHRIVAASESRKQARLERLLDEALFGVGCRLCSRVLSTWLARSRAHALELERIETASQYADCHATFRKWTQAMESVKEMEQVALVQFAVIVASHALSLWRLRMSVQIAAEIEAEAQATLKKGLLAKRLLRVWRRQHSHIYAKVDEWRADSDRQLAVIYFRTLQSKLTSRRAQRTGQSGDWDSEFSPQHTPSRRHAISPRALEMLTVRSSLPRNNNRAKTDEWGATPLSRATASHVSPPARFLSTPTKPLRRIRDLSLDSKSEL